MVRASALLSVVAAHAFEADPNRQQTLDAGILRYLARLLSILLGVSDDSATHEGAAKVLSLKELTFVRAATGAMLNSSLKFGAFYSLSSKSGMLTPQRRCRPGTTRVDAARIPRPPPRDNQLSNGRQGDCASLHDRQLGCRVGGLAAGAATADWVDGGGLGGECPGGRPRRRRVSHKRYVLRPANASSADKSDFPVDLGVPALASVILASASSPSTPSSVLVPSDDAADYLDTDIELLTISASLLEGVVQNSDAAKSAIAFSTFDPSLPYPQRTLLHHLIDFIKTARPPPYWSSVSDDPARTEKAFSTIKAAIVRAVVEAPNSDEVMERLWEDTKNGKDAATGGKSWLVEELVRWLEEAEEGREDMLVCASHMLAGLGRRGTWSEKLCGASEAYASADTLL